MPRGGPIAAAGRFGAQPYFPQADWLWRPIPASPVLDSNSATWAGYFSAGGTQHICDIIEFGTVLVGPSGITPSTPQHDITFRNATGGSSGANWGPDPFSTTMPIPVGTKIPNGSDGQVSVADPGRGQVFSIWQASSATTPWTASWGAQVPLYGDGLEPSVASQGSSTGARLSRFSCVIRAAEMTVAAAAGYAAIPHALFFSTDIASAAVRYPARVGDGANGAGVATPIPEGTRVQLDPSINVDGIAGITTWERIIAKTLQRNGAYVGDNGGARMAFIFEHLGTTAGENTAYTNVYSGIFDYYDMTHIPWSSLRVLRQWDGL